MATNALAQVLDDLAKAAGTTIARPTLTLFHNEQPVLLSTVQAVTVRETLTLLERCAPIRFNIVAGALAVEDSGESAQRRREQRWYPLNDYALMEPARDFPFAPLGLKSTRPIGGLQPPAERPTDSVAMDPATVVEFIQQLIAPASWKAENMSIEQRDGSLLSITNTPEVHADIHAALVAMHDFMNRGKRWQVTFGVLPATRHCATGIVPLAEAKALSARLAKPDVLTCAGLLDQQVHAYTGAEHNQIVAADAINFHLDARADTVRRGRAVVLRARAGRQLCLVSARLEWVEDVEPAAVVEVRAPAHVSAGSSTTTATTSPAAGAKNGKPTAGDPPPVTGLTTSTTQPEVVEGGRVRLDLPVLWTWQPRFECFLAPGQALVLVSEHPRGQAVMVLEELP